MRASVRTERAGVITRRPVLLSVRLMLQFRLPLQLLVLLLMRLLPVMRLLTLAFDLQLPLFVIMRSGRVPCERIRSTIST